MHDCIVPHANKLAKRAIGKVNAIVEFGLGCAYGPNFKFEGTNWYLSIYRFLDGWLVCFPFGDREDLYYEKLIHLYDDMMDLGAMEDSRFASNYLETFWLITTWDNYSLPDVPDEVKELSEKPTRGAVGEPGFVGSTSGADDTHNLGPQGISQ